MGKVQVQRGLPGWPLAGRARVLDAVQIVARKVDVLLLAQGLDFLEGGVAHDLGKARECGRRQTQALGQVTRGLDGNGMRVAQQELGHLLQPRAECRVMLLDGLAQVLDAVGGIVQNSAIGHAAS